MKARWDKIAYWLLFIAGLALAAGMNCIGLEAYLGKNSLFTAWDELYSVQEVYNILNAKDVKTLFLSIVAGKGYIYGRFVYVLDAILAFVPYRIFGLKGLVFSIRMAHTLCLFLGFHLFVGGLKMKQYQRVFCLIILCLFPFTIYFSGMPKPEPMQLLLIALFFRYRKHSFSWIFLGIAAGTKISIAFGVLWMVITVLLQWFRKETTLRSVLNQGLFFALGTVIALPGLLFAPFNSHFRSGISQIIGTASKPYDDV